VIAEALAEFAASSARVFEDRTSTVGASDVGQCARKVFYIKNEGDPDFGASRDQHGGGRWGATARGSTYEAHFWAPALREALGERLLFAGDQQETFTLEFLSGTPDALAVALESDVLAPLGVPDIGGDGSLLLEAKTIDPRSKLDGPRPEHGYQVQVGLGLLHALTTHRPEYALISYTDASFWDLVYEFPVRRDPTIFETAQHRAAQILTARSADELRPEGWIAGGAECARCEYSRACLGVRAAAPQQEPVEPPDAEFVAEIADLAREAKRAADALETATAAYRTAQHEIKERLHARGFRRVVGSSVSVTWSPVKGRPSYNLSAIRAAAAAAGVDITKFDTAGEPSDRLVIQTVEQSCPGA
jgi:hypothetical protein